MHLPVTTTQGTLRMLRTLHGALMIPIVLYVVFRPGSGAKLPTIESCVFLGVAYPQYVAAWYRAMDALEEPAARLRNTAN